MCVKWFVEAMIYNRSLSNVLLLIKSCFIIHGFISFICIQIYHFVNISTKLSLQPSAFSLP